MLSYSFLIMQRRSTYCSGEPLSVCDVWQISRRKIFSAIYAVFPLREALHFIKPENPYFSRNDIDTKKLNNRGS